jgi:hypothetical protein
MDEIADRKLAADEIAKLFGLKKANDWLEEAKSKPLPKALFGEFWSEGELGVMNQPTPARAIADPAKISIFTRIRSLPRLTSRKASSPTTTVRYAIPVLT